MSAPLKDPIRVTAAFYGRSYDKKMPFYGQDANLNTSYSGQRLAQHVKPGLVSFKDIAEVNGPWTWSKAHTLFGDREDRNKYNPHADPLQVEDRIPVMKGWDHLASAYALKSLQAEIEKHDPASAVGAAMIAAFAREIVKGKKHAFETEFHDEFVHRFREWIRGNGSEAEYREAGMESYVGNNSKRCKNKPISDHPSVLQYLTDWQSRVIDYNKKRAAMKLRLGRQGPYGEAASVDDLWKYYKFVVYGVESDDVISAAVDQVILEDRSKQNNVIQGPIGAVKVKATDPSRNSIPVTIEPLPQTSEEHRKDTIMMADVVTDDEEVTTIADHAKYKPSPIEERLLDEAYAQPPPKPVKEEVKPELPSPPSHPLPELDSGDAELQARADALKKESKPGPLPKFPKPPKDEPSNHDSVMLERIAKLQQKEASASIDKQRLESIFQATEQLMEQRLQEIHQMEARARAFFERLLATPAAIAPSPAVVPDAAVVATPAPAPVAVPDVAKQQPMIQPIAPLSKPTGVPDASMHLPVPAAVTQPIAAVGPAPVPDQPKLSPLPSVEPQPMPAVPEPASRSVKQKTEPEAQPTPSREPKSTAVERMQKYENERPAAVAEPTHAVAQSEGEAELAAWNDMLKAYAAQLPEALQKASDPNASEADRAKSEFLRRAVETLRTEIHTASLAESIAADARQRVRDATHVPNVLQIPANAPPAEQRIIPIQSVALGRTGRSLSSAKRISVTSRRSASPQPLPERSPPREEPRKDTPAVSPSKRKEISPPKKPISNVRGRKKKSEKTADDDEERKKGNKKNAKK